MTIWLAGAVPPSASLPNNNDDSNNITLKDYFFFIFSQSQVCLRRICLFCHAYLTPPNYISKAIIMLIIHWLLQLGRDTQYGIKWMITGSTLLTVVETIQIITNQQTNYWRYEWQRAISWRNSKLSLPLTSIYFMYKYKSIYIPEARH